MSISLSVPILVLIIVEIILMIGLPIAAVLILRRRWALPLSLAVAGAVTFVASQVLHIPANNLILGQLLDLQSRPVIVQAIALGLSAGLFEEIVRYVVYRFWRRDARSWREASFFGLGHGGIESIFTGTLVALGLVNVIIITLMEDPAAMGIPAEVLQEVAAFWEIPFYLPLLAVAERVMAMILHISLSTLVVLCFRWQTLWPLPVAILWHAIADAVAVYVAATWGNVAAEGALAVITLGSLGILWLTYRALQPMEGSGQAGTAS